jgi:phage terminase small subunit
LTPKQLNDREQIFVDEYLKTTDPKLAALAAGYSKSMADSKAYQWVSNGKVKPHVYAAIQRALQARSERTMVTVDRVVQELAMIAFADMSTYLTFDGEGGTTVRLDWSDLPAGATAIIQEITQEEHTGGRGHDTGQIRRTKFKLYSKLDALEKLGRHLSMFTDKVKIEGTFLDDLSPNELAALVEHLRAAGYGRALPDAAATAAEGLEGETRH